MSLLARALLVAITCSISTSGYAGSVENATNDYLKTGQEIVDMVNAGSIDVAGVESRVVSLTKNSVALALAYIEKHPEGEALLTEIISQVAIMNGGQVTGLGPMTNDSFDRMEKHWHDLGFLEGKDYGVDMEDEDNEHFTDPLQLMVHPIMVLSAGV